MNTSFGKLLIVSFFAAGTMMFAQTTPDQNGQAAQTQHVANPQKQLDHLTKKLALTGDQQNQILPILTDRDQQVSGIMNDASLSKKDRHAKLAAVRSDAESKLRNILTDTQRNAYDQMQQEARERAKARKQTTVNP
jgi:CBS-domain-containing membrane protein